MTTAIAHQNWWHRTNLNRTNQRTKKRKAHQRIRGISEQHSNRECRFSRHSTGDKINPNPTQKRHNQPKASPLIPINSNPDQTPSWSIPADSRSPRTIKSDPLNFKILKGKPNQGPRPLCDTNAKNPRPTLIFFHQYFPLYQNNAVQLLPRTSIPYIQKNKQLALNIELSNPQLLRTKQVINSIIHTHSNDTMTRLVKMPTQNF